MIWSSVDLPEPFEPITPIFAPGIEGEVDVLEHLLLAVVLGEVRDVEDVPLAHEFLGMIFEPSVMGF